jgi:hypothetical protein
MFRTVAVSGLSLALILSGVAGASSVQAQPPSPGTLCSFSLSPPQVVHVDGADMVTATLTPQECAGPFRPHLSVVCVQGADSSTQCSQGRGTATAQVYTPYRPGTSYTSTGRGLGTLFNDASEPNWQLLGPIQATL